MVLVNRVLDVDREGLPLTVTVTTLWEGTTLVSTVDPGTGPAPLLPFVPL